MSEWEPASLSPSLLCAVSSLSISLSTPPSSISSRNWSGSGSCRSMEIWVRTVYVIIASINALLICLGLQPSIHIVHPHARPSPNCCFTHTRARRHTFTHDSEKQADLQTDREAKLWENNNMREGWDQEGQQTECESTSLFMFGLSIWPSEYWLVIDTHQHIYIEPTVSWSSKQKNQSLDRKKTSN